VGECSLFLTHTPAVGNPTSIIAVFRWYADGLKRANGTGRVHDRAKWYIHGALMQCKVLIFVVGQCASALHKLYAQEDVLQQILDKVKFCGEGIPPI